MNALIYLCTCVKERKASLNFYTNLISEVIDIDFQQIWYFDVKNFGWQGMELSVILTQTVGIFHIRVTSYTGILTLAKLKYFIFKDLSTKAL